MEKFQDYWTRCLAVIKDNVSESAYETWFAPIVPIQYENNVFVLQVPSSFFVEYIEEHYIDLLRKVIYKEVKAGTKLEYRVLIDQTTGAGSVIPSAQNGLAAAQGKAADANTYSPQKVQLPELDPQLNMAYSFNTLIEGRSNKLARTAGISIANEPGNNAFNPLFVYGQSGVGKTHLGNAIGVMTKQLHPEKRVLYVPANTFQLQYTNAVRTNALNDFLNFYQTIDLLIVDDVHEFAGKTATQNTFFHIFNHLHQAGKQLILTSDRPPLALAGMEQRLLTRFKWGLSAEISRPDFQLRKDILKSKIYRDGLEIPEDVVDYIADNVVDNIRDLEGVLVSLMAHSTLLNTPIDMELTRQLVSRIVDVTPKVITVEHIRDTVCAHFDLPVDSILTKSRKREVVQARQISMYLAKQMTGSSLSTIGNAIGQRDHATVLHALTVVSDLMDIDKVYRSTVEQIASKIKA